MIYIYIYIFMQLRLGTNRPFSDEFLLLNFFFFMFKRRKFIIKSQFVLDHSHIYTLQFQKMFLIMVFDFNRALDFTVTLLQAIVKDFGLNMEQAVEESYNTTLKQWHGWISSAAYRVYNHTHISICFLFSFEYFFYFLLFMVQGQKCTKLIFGLFEHGQMEFLTKKIVKNCFTWIIPTSKS